MFDLFDNLRPGVYSRYSLSARQGGGAAARGAALVLPGGGAAAAVSVASGGALPQGVPVMAERCLALLFAAGVGRVRLVRGGSAAQALALVADDDSVGAVICDCETPEAFAALAEHVTLSAARMRERLGFCACGDADTALAAAKALCCERVALCCPAPRTEDGAHPLYGACAVAGRVLALPSPAHRADGAALAGLTGAQNLPEETVQRLLAAGVCVLEDTGAGVELVRAVTTRTKEGGAPDNALRPLGTVLVTDDVVRGLRGMLKARLGGVFGARAAGFSSIRDQVAVELAAKRDAGIIGAFDPPRVSADPDDPGVCLVDIAFSVAHLVSKIHLTAQIRV